MQYFLKVCCTFLDMVSSTQQQEKWCFSITLAFWHKC